MKFELGLDTLTFELGGSFPEEKPFEKVQITDRTAGGTLTGETLGVDFTQRRLAWDAMTKTDHDGLKNWFDTISNGAENTFSFTDEANVTADVRIISPTFNFRQITHEIYAGDILLEYV
jgi:hypothetical protein